MSEIIEQTPFPAPQYWCDQQGYIWCGPYHKAQMSDWDHYSFAKFLYYKLDCFQVWQYMARPEVLIPVDEASALARMHVISESEACLH